MTKRKNMMTSLLLGAALVGSATLVPMTAMAGQLTAGPSTSWTQSLNISSTTGITWAKGWGTYKTVTLPWPFNTTVTLPQLHVWLMGIHGSGAQSAVGTGLNSAGGVISTCRVVDAAFDLYPVTNTGSCGGAVKHTLQNNY